MNTLTANRRAVLLALSSAAFAILAAQAETPGDAPRPFGTDALSVFMAYQNALNAGDADATAAVWAENAQFAGGMGCPLAKPCIGPSPQ